MSGKGELAVVHVDTEPNQLVVAVLLFDGWRWTLRTVNPPEPGLMSDIKGALRILAAEFERNGF